MTQQSCSRVVDRQDLSFHIRRKDSVERRNDSRNCDVSKPFAIDADKKFWTYLEVLALPDEDTRPHFGRIQNIMRVRHDLSQLHQSLHERSRVGPQIHLAILRTTRRSNHVWEVDDSGRLARL